MDFFKLMCLLINFFILLRWAEAITWQKYVQAVQKRGPILPGRNCLHVIARYNLLRIYNTASRKWDRTSV